ncbi:MAG: hypothetical protein BWY66_02145 [bacterium ADurb.Bin374]|nr:MAG: hypothetical protein BWY66_02145 [bacterium ADurb.Bin374]
MIFQLSTRYPSRYAVPVVSTVDSEVFEKRSFGNCLECGFCHDSCCSYGVDVDALNGRRIMQHADQIRDFTGINPKDFFQPTSVDDPEFPGGSFVRTMTVGERCIFLNREGGKRGCLLHSFCLQQGIDYHEIKPMVSCLFPVTFDDGLLHAMDEVIDRSLVCLDQGPTLYRSSRDELKYYFGTGLIAELDTLEQIFKARSEKIRHDELERLEDTWERRSAK